MNTENQVDRKLANEQWLKLHHLIIRIGGDVHYIDPHPNLPDMVFTANAGFPYGKDFWISQFKHSQRQAEEGWFLEYFLRNGFSVNTLIERDHDFEGMGDVLQMGKYLWFGWGFRSDRHAKDWLGPAIKEKYGKEFNCVDVRMVNPRFYHLDTCFCPLNDKIALVYTGAFSYFPRYYDLEFIDVPKKEAENFACNAVCIGNHVILPEGSDETCNRLSDNGFIPHQTPMTEFIKSGGACKCLTLKF